MNRKYIPYIFVFIVLVYSLYSNLGILRSEREKSKDVINKDSYRFVLPGNRIHERFELINLNKDDSRLYFNSNFVDIPIYTNDIFIIRTDEQELFVPYASTSEIEVYELDEDEKALIDINKKVLIKKGKDFSRFFIELLKKSDLFKIGNEHEKIMNITEKADLTILPDNADINNIEAGLKIGLRDKGKTLFGKTISFKSIEFISNSRFVEDVTLRIPEKKKMKMSEKWDAETYRFKSLDLEFYVFDDYPVMFYLSKDMKDIGVISFYDEKVQGFGFYYDQGLKKYSYSLFI